MGKVVIPPDLLPRVAAGDEQAFEELYELTYRPVFAFLLSLTANEDDAKDLMQETYIRVHGSAHLYRNPGNPMAWIMKIGRNLFLMEKRKRTVIPVDPEEGAVENELLFEGFEKDIEQKMFLKQLFTVLNEKEREIVVLHVAAGFRHREIASFLGMPLGTVLSKYHRAMKKLESSARAIEAGDSDVR